MASKTTPPHENNFSNVLRLSTGKNSSRNRHPAPPRLQRRPRHVQPQSALALHDHGGCSNCVDPLHAVEEATSRISRHFAYYDAMLYWWTCLCIVLASPTAF